MKVAIMQPYFFPYIGYFQLMNAVDEFVVYDNIEFTKKGWINRNRILLNGKDEYISLPLKKASDYLPICERYLADSWEKDRKKMLNKIQEAYKKAPHFDAVNQLVLEAMNNEIRNLFDFLLNCLTRIAAYLKITTPIIISSKLAIDHTLKGEQKVISICNALHATQYFNPIGGVELYKKENFSMKGIQLQFLEASPFAYSQFNQHFLPWLSIIDVMMFNPIEEIENQLKIFKLL
jgi:hypothetical protein